MRALIPGSFDPCTVGHIALIEEVAARFDEVVVAVFINPEKQGLFSHADRVRFLRLATAHLKNVTVDFSDGMVADYVKRHRIDRIVKGVRNGADRAYEETMAAYNFAHSGVETLLLPAESHLEAVSSTRVREGLAAGEPLTDLLPAAAAEAIREAYRQGHNA